MYGGGPIIVREDLDIYSRDLSKDLHKKWQKDTKKENNTNIFAPIGKSSAQKH